MLSNLQNTDINEEDTKRPDHLCLFMNKVIEYYKYKHNTHKYLETSLGVGLMKLYIFLVKTNSANELMDTSAITKK